jgi:hypothetical protein
LGARTLAAACPNPPKPKTPTRTGFIAKEEDVITLVGLVPCFSLIVPDFNKTDFNYLGSLALQISRKTQVSSDLDMYIFINSQILGNTLA